MTHEAEAARSFAEGAPGEETCAAAAPSGDSGGAGGSTEVSLRIHRFHADREQRLFAASAKKAATLYPNRSEHFAELLLAPFRAVFPGKDFRVAGTKLAMYEEATDLDAIRTKIVPFKIVHILRNPIDTIASSLTRRNLTRMGYDRWHVQDVAHAAFEWSMTWHQLVARKRREGDNMLVLKYEDFAADFPGTTARLADFLGIERLFKEVFLPLPGELRRRSLSAKEAAFLEPMFADLEANWLTMGADALLKEFPILPFPYTPGAELRFCSRGNGVPHLLAGFSMPELWGVWTQGPRARLALRLPESSAVRLDMRFRVFAPKYRDAAGFVLTAGGRPVSRFDTRRAGWGQVFEHSIEVAAELVAHRVLDLGLLVINACRPEECPPDDPRQIGIGLEQMSLTPIKAAPAPNVLRELSLTPTRGEIGDGRDADGRPRTSGRAPRPRTPKLKRFDQSPESRSVGGFRRRRSRRLPAPAAATGVLRFPASIPGWSGGVSRPARRSRAAAPASKLSPEAARPKTRRRHADRRAAWPRGPASCGRGSRPCRLPRPGRNRAKCRCGRRRGGALVRGGNRLGQAPPAQTRAVASRCPRRPREIAAATRKADYGAAHSAAPPTSRSLPAHSSRRQSASSLPPSSAAAAPAR